MSGVVFDRVAARMKVKVFKTVVKPAMRFGLETPAQKNLQEEVAELKMLRFSLGVMRIERIRNELIRGQSQRDEIELSLTCLEDVWFFSLISALDKWM